MITTAGANHRILFSSASDEYGTPANLWDALNAEFKFNDDACPLGGDRNGLMREWGSRCWVNPPYSEIIPWMEKAKLESDQGKTVVFLVPARTDTRWFHEYALAAREIRFIRGRLKFEGASHNAPFPSMIVIFDNRAKQ